MNYVPADTRYDTMIYNRCGASGLKLPAVSLGLWHNFGDVDDFENCRKMIHTAFDLGITHFDLANNYGPPAGSAEINFGKILRADLSGYRDELIISTKAGYTMWEGPYGDWGSRKYMLASLDQSLRRLGLGYVDIFYSHRFDPETPLEETMSALAHAVRAGKALYAGISNYPPEQTSQAVQILRQMGVKCLLHQPKYSMLNRTPEQGLLDVLEEEGIGCIVFCPLAQGLLTNKYLDGIPAGSRAARNVFLKSETITQKLIDRIKALNEIALQRGQSLAQMALAWVLRDRRVTSVLIGASRAGQVSENVAALDKAEFTKSELEKIEMTIRQP